MSDNNVPPVAVPPQPPIAQQPPAGQAQPKGFAVTALVLGIIAILGSWIPFLSIGSALIGLVGLVFGIIAVVKALKGTAGGKVMAIVGTALSGLAIIFAIISTAAGVAAVDGSIEDLEDEVTAATTAAPTTEPADGSDVDEESSEAPTDDEATEQGTRDNPFPAGSVLTDDSIEVTIGDANWDAGDVVAQENQFNEPAPEGTTYVIAPVTISNVASTEPITPWLELTVFYVAADGRSFDEASVVVPEDVIDIDDLYEGGTGTGNLVFAIPTDAQEGGVWGVELGWFSDTVFVEAQ